MDDPERGKTQAAGLLDERHGHASHRPPGHDVGSALLHVAREHGGVVALEREALPNAQARELVVLPVPTQVAIDVPALGCAPDGAVAMPVVRR